LGTFPLSLRLRYCLPLVFFLLVACGAPVPAPRPALPQTDAPVSSPPPAAAAPANEERSTVPAFPPQAAARFPESVLGVPETDSASPKVRYDTVVLARAADGSAATGWELRTNKQNQIVGFEFSNPGGNRILPQRYDISKDLLFTRDFQFRFDDRARQDIHLAVSDWAPGANRQFKLSDLMNTILLFFPRIFLPAITRAGRLYIVTLPTGERIDFDAESREIMGGVLTEGPVDLSPGRVMRKFPAVVYTGKGVSVRANARGTDPRIATTATITNGSGADCGYGPNCNRCQVPAKDLWHQTGAVRFKFSTDVDFERYLRARCGFGLPSLEPSLTS
jgi:hypothetical protein